MTRTVLALEEAGNPDGPPLLMVHGFLSSNAQWDLNRERLGERYRLLMVELPGHGQSPAPSTAEGYSTDQLVEAFEKVRRDHAIDRWWVCGQSLGGAIMTWYCLAVPEVVHGLVFTNSRAMFGIDRPGVSQRRPKPITSTRDIAVHPINAKRLPEAVKQRMVEAADTMSVDAVNQFISRRSQWKATDRMHELAMPVLLVNGRWEKAFQPHVPQAQGLIADLTVVDLEGGHAINVEQPDAFNSAVIDFIG